MLPAGVLMLLMMSLAMAEEKAGHDGSAGPTVVYSAKFPVTVENREYEMKCRLPY